MIHGTAPVALCRRLFRWHSVASIDRSRVHRSWTCCLDRGSWGRVRGFFGTASPGYLTPVLFSEVLGLVTGSVSGDGSSYLHPWAPHPNPFIRYSKLSRVAFCIVTRARAQAHTPTSIRSPINGTCICGITCNVAGTTVSREISSTHGLQMTPLTWLRYPPRYVSCILVFVCVHYIATVGIHVPESFVYSSSGCLSNKRLSRNFRRLTGEKVTNDPRSVR